MKFCEKLVVLRSRKGFTQEGLAKAAGVTQKAVFDWEHGARPRKSSFIKLAVVLGADVEMLADDNQDPPEPAVSKKTKALYGEAFADHLRGLKKDSELLLFENAEQFMNRNSKEILSSIDLSLRGIYSELKKITEPKNQDP